uniref:Putative RING-H2 finger protein ATL56-like n=1 Tax=Davidia involucrata TaxID=16924 RepID=A0A5B7BV41_DAVIN
MYRHISWHIKREQFFFFPGILVFGMRERKSGTVMVMEIVISVILLFVGIAVLVIIHVCIVGRAFGGSYNNGTIAVQRRSSTRSPSMSHEDIKRLPCFDYKLEEGENNRPMDCAVCLENFKLGDKCRLLPNCKHSFHAQCIDSWLLKTAICPICRTGTAYTEPKIAAGQSSNSSEVEVEVEVELT